MARNLISWPQVVFPAFNPATVYAEATNGEEDIEMYFIIDGVAATRHKREFFAFAQPLTDNFGAPITDNGGQLLPVGGTPTARFDLGQVAKWYFSNAVEEINAADNTGTWKTKAYMERRLSFPFRAEFMQISEGEVTAGIDFVAVNAALPAGVAEADYQNYKGRMLVEMSVVYNYQGYTNKSKLSALCDNEGRLMEFALNPRPFEYEVMYTSAVGEGINRVVSVDIPDYQLGPLGTVVFGTHELAFPDGCIPPSPFYVRWVNRLGGREHWMFSGKQSNKIEASDPTVYDPYFDTNAKAGQTPRQLSIEINHTAVVGAEGVDAAAFEPLRRITQSPLIEWYDKAQDKWFVITVKSATVTTDSGSPKQSMEIEFNLPSINTQF